VGTLLEIALAADRTYMLATQGADAPQIALSELNFGAYPTVARVSRIAARFYGESEPITRAREMVGRRLNTAAASSVGLVTSAPDELDWDDEVRIAIEERTSLSPDALTGMEANLRFGPGETMETRVFGRLSGWQNWIFIRPNAVGKSGALKVFGTGNKPEFDWDRV
jgi:benzoyl-CoA-dihydrodiol lyase